DTIEAEGGIDLEEMVMTAHLHGAVTGICDSQGDGGPAHVEGDVAVYCQDFARNHTCLDASADGLMNSDELRAVGKGRLDLDVMNHLGYPLHDLVTFEHLGACLHEMGHAQSVPRAFNHHIGDERHGFRVVELHATLQAPSRNHGCHRNEEFV